MNQSTTTKLSQNSIDPTDYSPVQGGLEPISSQTSTSDTVRAGQEVPFGESLRDVTAADALRQLEKVLGSADAQHQQTAAALKRFASTGDMVELRNLDRQDVESLAEFLTQNLSKQELDSILERTLGLTASQVNGQDDPKTTLVGIYDAIAGNYSTEVRPSTLMITDQTTQEGRITGQMHVLPVGTQKVYAVFENDMALQGLDQVLAVWRDPSDDQMVFTQFEPVRKGSAYNYVWLEVASGWPAGRYQVELFHPEAQSLLLASESFSVR